MNRLLFLPLFALATCQTPDVTPGVVVAPIGPAAIAENAAQTQQIKDLKAAVAAKETAAQTASGKVAGAVDANTHNPAGPAKDTTAAFASAALGSLPPPTDAQKAENEAQINRALNGQLTAVVAELAGAKAQAEIDAKARKDAEAKIAMQDAALLKLKADAAAEQERNRVEVQAAFDRKQKELADTRKAMNDAVMAKQVLALNWAGGISLLIFGLAVGFGQLAGAKLAWPFIVFAPLCFGLAQICSQWWFKWAILGVVGIGCVIVGIWLWHQHREGELKAAAQAKAAQLGNALGAVVPVLDAAYDKAEPAAKEVLDRVIFDPLSSAMDKATKSVIHSIRAEPPATP